MPLENVPYSIIISEINCSGLIAYDLNATVDLSGTRTEGHTDTQQHNKMRAAIHWCKYPICFVSCHQSKIICTHTRDVHPFFFSALNVMWQKNLSVHHMTTSLQADALNGLQLVNYSLLGLLYPRWCSVSPTADKRESHRDIKIPNRMESLGGGMERLPVLG